MLIPVEDIIVKKRIRKEMGDITALAESMKHFGQISPIVVTKNNVLVAGGRRLEAARSLGWKTINAVTADINDDLSMLEYEMEENNQRSGFTEEESKEAAERLEKLRHPPLFRRILNAIIRFFRKIFKRKD